MTTPLKLAESYMKAFFGPAPLEELEILLADELVFEGPFHQSRSAKEYLQALRDSPLDDAHYIIEKAYEDENSACLIYVFSKPGVKTRMVQTFEVADNRICKINLVFDARAFD